MVEQFPLPPPFYGTWGDEYPPPETDPGILSKRQWERESSLWKKDRILLFFAIHESFSNPE